MTPAEMKSWLKALVDNGIDVAVMLWGAPGIGKSSIVAQVAEECQMELVDLRLSQLAPTDLRGLPGVNDEENISKWYPPEFLPREGRGILFLDELNMAPPTLQGIAQQLILDRQVGSYHLPEGWFVWSAGNRKEDKASVFDMPSPLANRFIHLEVSEDFNSFRTYAIENDVHEQVMSFLNYRPDLLHKLDRNSPAWPSPRSWFVASRLHNVGLSVAPAVGEGAGSEFATFIEVYDKVPPFEPIFAGKGDAIDFPEELSVRYATVIGLAMRAEGAKKAHNALKWIHQYSTLEWVQLYATNLFITFRKNGQIKEMLQLIQKDPIMQKMMEEFRELYTT